MMLFIKIPENKDQIFDHYIGLYDKGTHVYADIGDPNIVFSYRLLSKEDIHMKYRSAAENFFTTEFFNDYTNVAYLLGPKK